MNNCSFVDESDPDFSEDNSMHLYQTAEACRAQFPDCDWMHVVGLVHDLGKSPLQKSGLPQWAIGGDTFPVGCAHRDENKFVELFDKNADRQNESYASHFGIYKEGFGFNQLTMAFGHDEYMYQVLKSAPHCKLPAEALYIVVSHFHLDEIKNTSLTLFRTAISFVLSLAS